MPNIKKYKRIFHLFVWIFVLPTLVYAANGNDEGSADWKLILQLFSVIIAILILIVSSLNFYKGQIVNRKKDKEQAYRNSVKKSFDIYFSSEIDDISKRLLGGDSGYKIPYVHRKADRKLRQFEQRLLSGNILLTGRRGIGKTREAIETIKRLAKQTGEEIIVLVPQANMDTGFVLEISNSHRIGLLLIDDIHKAFFKPMSGNNSGDLDDRDFLERLSATLGQLKEGEYFDQIYCIFTCRDEPGWEDKIKLRAKFWSDNAFSTIQIPWINDEREGPAFIRQVSKYFKFRITDQAIQKITSCWDGTCSAIITSFNILKLNGLVSDGVITEQAIENFSFTYPKNWYFTIYQNQIQSIPEQKAVFDALAFLQRIQLPTYRFLVVDIAATLVKGPFAWLWRKKIDKAITNLQGWMFDYKEEIICPNAYIDSIESRVLTSFNVLPAFKRAFKNKDHAKQLSPYLQDIVLSTRSGLLSSQTGIDLLKCACGMCQ